MPTDPDAPPDLDALAEQPQPGLLVEMRDFLRQNRKWFLLPILALIGLFGILAALASTGVAPFIYTLF